MELEHFSHDHPLMLYTEHKDYDAGELSCYGCEQPISDSFYGCKRCWFFLHKSCAELPREMIHHSHPHHPLTLLLNPPSQYGSGGFICDVCDEKCSRFSYHCSPCMFDLDIKCASVMLNNQQSIQHPSHPHSLIPLRKPSMFLCDACGTEHKGTSYVCTPCGFWINQKCAESPLTIRVNCHHHTLPLVFPNDNFSDHDSACKVCRKAVYRWHWAYYCSECRYVAHINCATSVMEHSTDWKTGTECGDLELNAIEPDSGLLGTTTSDAELSKTRTAQIKAKELGTSLIYLPRPDESVDMFSQFIKSIRIHGRYKEEAEIMHSCHEHPLTFSTKKAHDDSCCTSNLPLLNEAKNDEKCNGCAQSISAPFCHCDQCNFFLHEWCAELPNELLHPCHPEHPLLLTSNIFVIAPCECCKLHCNGFVFTCFTCGFILDSKCASLPRAIKHEAHKHNLALRRTSFGSCSSCNDRVNLAFECQGCKFNLCVWCALLPSIVRHRYDKHPFILTYSPLAYQTNDDVCEICEKGIDSKHWFYHCGKCDQYLHTKCALPIDEFSNIKYGNAVILNIDHHPDSVYPDSAASRIGISNAEPSRDYKAIIKAEDIHPILITLPFSDESVDPITQFVKELLGHGKYNEVTEIKHDTHEHTLIKQVDGMSNNKMCNGCAQTISTPFYCCDQCNYSLHQWCAELPNEMRHPCHPKHPLLFTANSVPYRCQCCSSFCIAFGFRCSTCEFFLDSECASLPRIIRHEAHEHTLALSQRWPRNCCACGTSFIRFAFVCSPCNFKLCVRCAISPRTLRRNAIDPYTLAYHPLQDQAGKSDCTICKQEINHKLWFYNHDNGRGPVHTECIRRDFWFLTDSKFALTVRIDNHPHLLLSVVDPFGYSNCHHCGQRTMKYRDFVYECRPCDFWIHDHCPRALLFGLSN